MVERIRPAARPRLLKPAQARAILAGYFDKAQSMRVLADKVHVSCVDDGPPAEVNVSAAVMPDYMAESGRGLPLARTVLDRLHYRRSFVNHWTLVSRQFA